MSAFKISYNIANLLDSCPTSAPLVAPKCPRFSKPPTAPYSPKDPRNYADLFLSLKNSHPSPDKYLEFDAGKRWTRQKLGQAREHVRRAEARANFASWKEPESPVGARGRWIQLRGGKRLKIGGKRKKREGTGIRGQRACMWRGWREANQTKEREERKGEERWS